MNKHNRVFFCYYIIMLAIHLLLPLEWADDKIFLERVVQTTLQQFINGSARPITDSLTYIFASFPLMWRILNPMVLTLSAKLLSEFLPSNNVNKNKLNIFICIAVIYPSLVTVDAGFIATTVNYLWPFTAGLITLIPLKKLSENKIIFFYDYLYSIPATLCAVNMQQTAACLTAVFFSSIIYSGIKKKLSFYPLFQFFLSFVSSVFILYINTVGSNNRMMREASRYFPSFSELNLFQKAELGFSSTFYCMTMETRFAFFAFALFTLYIAVKVLKSKTKIFNKIISSFPFCFTILIGCFSVTPIEQTNLFSVITGGMKHFRMNQAIYSFNLIPDLIFISIIACIIVSMYITLYKKEFIIGLFILAIGICSRIIMGFSPTVWASGYRTFFILFISFISLIVLISDSKKPQEI